MDRGLLVLVQYCVCEVVQKEDLRVRDRATVIVSGVRQRNNNRFMRANHFLCLDGACMIRSRRFNSFANKICRRNSGELVYNPVATARSICKRNGEMLLLPVMAVLCRSEARSKETKKEEVNKRSLLLSLSSPLMCVAKLTVLPIYRA